MIQRLKLVKIDSKYCDYLRKFDNKVPYNSGEKETRPFVGVLFNFGNIEYFAPLSSPKEKHLHMKNTIDFWKIDDGKLGAINFNNMIPVTAEQYKLINLNKKTKSFEELKYLILLQNQLAWLNSNINQLSEKAYKLYIYYKEDRLPISIKKRTCNFSLLEEKLKEYKMK